MHYVYGNTIRQKMVDSFGNNIYHSHMHFTFKWGCVLIALQNESTILFVIVLS